SEDNHNEDDHVKEVDYVNENENKSDGNDQSVREENKKGDDASSEVVDDSQKTAEPMLDLVLCEVMVIKTPEPCISLVNVLGNSIC
ncbi:hypothetical protein Tco_1138497, partial [Tanacetum coccineum]